MNRPLKPEDVTEWMDKYLSDELSPEERVFFEAVLLEDDSLAAQLEEQIQARNMLAKIFQEERLREEIRKFGRQENRRILRRNILKYSSAACLVVFLGIFFLLNSLPVFPDSENDFTVVRGADESVMRSDRRMVFDSFFSGQAHIAEGEYALAATNFEQVLQEEDLRPYFREAAEWHLLVAYLKSGKLNKANELYSKFASCTDCEYEVSSINRWKIWLQIKYSQAVSQDHI